MGVCCNEVAARLLALSKLSCRRAECCKTELCWLQARFTEALMKDKAKVDFPADRIFSTTVSGQPKSEVLQELEQKHPGTEYHFVEDKLGTLDKVVTCARHTLMAAAVVQTCAKQALLGVQQPLLPLLYYILINSCCIGLHSCCQRTQHNCARFHSKHCTAAVPVCLSADCTHMHTNNWYDAL